jgi:hypothetical protein
MTNQWEAVFNGEKKKLSLVKTTHPRPIQRGKPIFIWFEDGTSVGWVCGFDVESIRVLQWIGIKLKSGMIFKINFSTEIGTF